ncbi:MAG: polyphosphate kinase 2 family protein [Gammaproteobacteria bacterium]|nr:polyphosphate kinase 2 family protein [Gammaproteobacteria bacterium]MCG3145106.1 Polyphosphate:ADP phosphotransferase [Gammaproteobacteria bacterium]
MQELVRLVRNYRVTNGRKFDLADFDPADTNGLAADFKDDAQALLREGIERLGELQEKLYAQDRWSVLLIFQAMDAAGKDSTIKHVMSGVNPQGCQVFSFKTPSSEELDHDYLWRTTRCLPERGRIGIFNRSYYEEVLVVRVHQEILAGQRIPPALVTADVWKERYQDISAFERYLGRNGTVVRKFFLHMSRAEQKKRFLDRIEEPAKRWKFAAGDVAERAHWDRYMQAYGKMIRHTASVHAPWYVVPADNKWYTRMIVAGAIVDTLLDLDLHFPKFDARKRKELEAARAALMSEKGR